MPEPLRSLPRAPPPDRASRAMHRHWGAYGTYDLARLSQAAASAETGRAILKHGTAVHEELIDDVCRFPVSLLHNPTGIGGRARLIA